MRLPLDDSPYIVGIDLGTTNSSIAQIDGSPGIDRAQSRTCPVAQLVNPGEVAPFPLLPSFLYVAGDVDFPKGSLALPWDDEPTKGRERPNAATEGRGQANAATKGRGQANAATEGRAYWVVGELARKRGAEAPARLVASAKSWLSYAGVDRTAPILPWQAAPDVRKLSPLQVSTAYLSHLRHAWDAASPGLALADQDVVLTVPASFDEEARELTRRAALEAGLERLTLLEEPQAAFYAWLEAQGDAWRDRIHVGDLVLVCDVGGGTTDFSLITVSEEAGDLVLERVAVGDHILLGGDNMDLALARLLQQRLEAAGHRIDSWQLQALWYQSRAAKEHLFEDPGATAHEVVIRGRGTKLVGGTLRAELRRDDLQQVLIDGFFPIVRAARPARARRVGFQELGLPYAADPAVTRHLARFLAAQAGSGRADGTVLASPSVRRGRSGMACPTHVLFNGGVMKAPALRERIVSVLNGWLQEEGVEPLAASHVLDAPDLDLAVARGAACYGRARRAGGVRIRAGVPRTYYIGIESAMPAVPGLPAPLKALCVVPFGMEEGSEAEIPQREFGLVVGEPAEFRFLTSTVRKDDRIGSLVEDWGDDIEELSPLEVLLTPEGQEEEVVPVRLLTRVTEVGTLELWCVSRDGEHRWKLELNVRERRPDATA